MPGRRGINARNVMAPAAAFTMACVLFVYTRTSIRAAKANAQRHREADSGGEGLNLLAESRRRHGMGEKVEQGGTVRQLAQGAKEQFMGGKKGSAEQGGGEKVPGAEEEAKLKAAMGRRKDG